jgi:hypothetical protein
MLFEVVTCLAEGLKLVVLVVVVVVSVAVAVLAPAAAVIHTCTTDQALHLKTT